METSLASSIEAANSTLVAGGKLEAVGEFFTPDYVAHTTGQDASLGHDGVRSVLGLYRRAFPDLRVEVEILVERGAGLPGNARSAGPTRATSRVSPPSGRPIVWRDMATSRFRDGLIAEEWVVTDLAERLLLSRKT